MTTPKNELQIEIDELRNKLEIMRKIGTQNGFIQFYFTSLKNPEYKSNQDCFNKINEMYFEFFGEYRYSDFDSLRKAINRNYKK